LENGSRAPADILDPAHFADLTLAQYRLPIFENREFGSQPIRE